MSAAEAMSAALLHLLDRGQRPPCAETDAPDPCAEDADERAEAATRCAGCPIVAECGALGDETSATFGVYGGTDRERRTTTRKRGTAA